MADGLPYVSNESSDDVLKSVKSLYGEAKMVIPPVVVDRIYIFGPYYLDKSSNKNCKRFMIRFTTFQRRTMFCRVKKK